MAQYKCEFCGKTHDSADSYVYCVTRCGNRVKEEARKAKESKLKAEKQARMREVAKAKEAYETLLNQYERDYGDSTTDLYDIIHFFDI